MLLVPVLAATHAFAFDLYGRLADGPGNLAFSPASVEIALTMTWEGARGETAAEMKRVLHLDGQPASDLGGADRKVVLRVANRLFGERTYRFEPPFRDRIEPLDFKGAPDAARRRINDWVADQTEKRITNLLPEGSIKPVTRLVLTNAIYFLGDWQSPFQKEWTRPQPFHAHEARLHDVPMMHQASTFPFAETGGVKVLEMPYAGGDTAMDFVLPDAPDALPKLERRLTPELFDGWLRALEPQRVAVSLPRVTIDPPEPTRLSDALQALGMKRAFDPEAADLTGIANPPDKQDRLFIGEVFHKAFVRIDEKGTEAAAATAVVAPGGTGAAPKAKEFRADHPFLFVLRDLRTGRILFMGHVYDPR
jgi:serine protease inhibitor